MHRFFLPPENIKNNKVEFPEPVVRQLRNVLRLKPGDLVQVLDNKGSLFTVKLEIMDARSAQGTIIEKTMAIGEPKINIHLYFSLSQREKMEWILQKCTEIGVTAFTPFVSTYSLSREKGLDASKVRRWEKIIQEAAEQCGRAHIPDLNDLLDLSKTIKKISSKKDINLAAWEGEKQNNLRMVLAMVQSNLLVMKKVNLLIGPEGGFTENEVMQMKTAGCLTFSLGERILRMETAAMAASAQILFELEDSVRQ